MIAMETDPRIGRTTISRRTGYRALASLLAVQIERLKTEDWCEMGNGDQTRAKRIKDLRGEIQVLLEESKSADVILYPLDAALFGQLAALATDPETNPRAFQFELMRCGFKISRSSKRSVLDLVRRV